MIEIIIVTVSFLVIVLGVVIWGSRQEQPEINEHTREAEINVRRRQ